MTTEPKKITPVRFMATGPARLTVTLEDGLEIQVAVMVQSVGRMEGEKDPFGNQAYWVNTACVPSPATPPAQPAKGQKPS